MIGLIRVSAGFLAALTGIVLVIAIAVALFDQQKVEYVAISGELDEKQLNSVRNHLAGIQPADLSPEEVKSHLDALDWVHHVNVTKDWPAGFSIEVVPEEVIAYWNDNGFINEEGKVLSTDLLIGGDLPHLYGPDGSEFRVMNQYQQLNRTLSSAGFTVELLRLNERGAWLFETSDRIRVLLGKEDLMARVERFLNVSARLQEEIEDGAVDRMDARYVNGVAVHFNEQDPLGVMSANDPLTEIEIADLNNSVGEQAYD